MIRTRGDTIIELMLAFSIFSLAAVSTISLMNKGVAISQQSLEVSLVRAQVDSQGEIIRYLRDTSNPLWSTITSRVNTNTKIAPLSPSTCPSPNDIADYQGFFVTKGVAGLTLNEGAGNFADPVTYSQIGTDNKAYGLWVQIAKADPGTTPTSKSIVAYDVYIHACWSSLVSDNAPATLGTIVRIYDK
jgi:type II secretory pathway pseudopilin PulG